MRWELCIPQREAVGKRERNPPNSLVKYVHYITRRWIDIPSNAASRSPPDGIAIEWRRVSCFSVPGKEFDAVDAVIAAGNQNQVRKIIFKSIEN